MIHFILRRVLESFPTLVLLSILVFALFKLVPGDYLSEMELNPTISAERVEEMRHDLGLDRSLPAQYGSWLVHTLRGEFGYSFAQRRPAAELILERLAGTLILTVAAFLLTLVLSLPLGVLLGFNANRWMDRIGLWLAIGSLSLPSLLSALLFLYFAYWSRWFPVGGSDSLRHVVLPAFTLAIPAAGFFVRTLRLELIEVLRQPFMVAVYAKGLNRWKIVWHALRNAFNPLISLSGITVGGLLSGAVVVEKIFAWPGIGALTVDSIQSRDLYVALNCVLVSAVLVIVSNLAADVVLALNDPRIRLR